MAERTIPSAARVPAARAWGGKNLPSPVFTVGKIRKGLAGGSEREAVVELRIEGLDAADKLGERPLDPDLVDSRRAEGRVEEDLVFGQCRHFREQVRKIRVAIGAAESHFDRVSERLARLIFQGRRTVVPKEARFGEAGVDEAHRVARRHPGYASAGERGIAESVGLLVTGAATYGVVTGEALVIKEDAAESRAGIRDSVCHRAGSRCDGRVISEDVAGFDLLCIIWQRGEIDHAVLGIDRKSVV